MQRNVNLLPIDDIKGIDQKKLTKNKDIYELRYVNENAYVLKPFTMLYYNGNFNEYLIENKITLCFMVEETDIKIKNYFKEYIKSYNINEEGLLELHQDKVITKKTKKRDLSK